MFRSATCNARMDDLLIPPVGIVACWLPVLFEAVPAILIVWLAFLFPRVCKEVSSASLEGSSASVLELWLSFRRFGECREWRASIDMA